METKVNNGNNVKEVIMYCTSIKFEGKWITTPPTPTIEEQLKYIERARMKTHSKNLPMNLFTITSYVPAE